MITKLKSNKIIVVLLFGVCVLFIISPAIYTKSCLDAISVWAFNVLPCLLPFFIITRLIVNLITPKKNFADKFFYKAYNTPALSSTIYLLSIISGYPMGAKLICNLYEKDYISQQEAQTMLAYCSVSGPMFIIGAIGIATLHSYKAGLVILIANIIASLINGLIYKNKQKSSNKNTTIVTDSLDLSGCVYDSLISVLMVGGFIVLSFLAIDLLKNINIIGGLANMICFVFKLPNNDVVQAVLSGLIEITRGTIDLSKTTSTLAVKTTISSALIGFGGISVLMQSLAFVSRLNIKAGILFKQKLTQGLICLAVSIPLTFLIL